MSPAASCAAVLVAASADEPRGFVRGGTRGGFRNEGFVRGGIRGNESRGRYG
jgi:hypothetical protein